LLTLESTDLPPELLNFSVKLGFGFLTVAQVIDEDIGSRALLVDLPGQPFLNSFHRVRLQLRAGFMVLLLELTVLESLFLQLILNFIQLGLYSFSPGTFFFELRCMRPLESFHVASYFFLRLRQPADLFAASIRPLQLYFQSRVGGLHLGNLLAILLLLLLQ